MNFFVLKKHLGSYEEAYEMTVGVFDSMEKSLDKISKVEGVIGSEILIDKDHSDENTLWTENMFEDKQEGDFSACYSIEKFILND